MGRKEWPQRETEKGIPTNRPVFARIAVLVFPVKFVSDAQCLKWSSLQQAKQIKSKIKYECRVVCSFGDAL